MLRRGIACMAMCMALAATFVVVAAGPASAQPAAFMVGFNQNLYSLDLTTGASTLIGPTGADDIRSIALAPHGTLYGIDEHSGAGNVDELVTIDQATGVSTPVGLLGFDMQNTGLTFGLDGRMWLSDSADPRLFEVDPTTGAATLVGPTSGIFVTGLAGACDGRILGAGNIPGANYSLVSLDTATGTATPIGSLGVLVFNADIAFDYASQTLYGVEVNGNIFTIDLATGAATLTAPIIGGVGANNVAVDPITCPAPPEPLAAAPVVVTPTFTG